MPSQIMQEILSGSYTKKPGAGPDPPPPPPEIGKNMIFWRKIVIFHTKYPKNVRITLRSVQFF
jgi:hypothetical protein